MLFDDPACFCLDRIPVGPIYWLWRPYLACGKPGLRGSRPACAEGRLSFVAVVEFDLAARRQLTPMRVRPTDPCRAQRRPYGLTALDGGESDAHPPSAFLEQDRCNHSSEGITLCRR
jgi:hypothetical protein